ncbi:class I SAM-dependent methyltransferase [Mesorhizobium xinjiangense]|uniref:class I SAM-dependent methyltransferase n=1 Tax=Mesorhizobium xinjiangense TaxID=2678685 RepID=UPI0012ECE17C|nr:class I SAM-dependent methyltransferase [Mesorhizobium xinjiangense]
MTDDTQKTLFYPFEAEILAMPGADTRVLFIGAPENLRPPSGFCDALQAVQGFRPAYLGMEQRGYSVAPDAEGEAYDMALVLAGRHRGQNEAWLAEAVRRVAPGGLVVVAGSKKDGADSLRKRTARIVPLEDHLSKHHGIAFWFRNNDPGAVDRLQPGPRDRVDGRFETAPGMFSHDRIDPASELLARHLPDAIFGRVADFGAGWGYLSAEVLRRGEAIDALDLYEADHAALQAAGRNLAPLAGDVPLGLFWRDLLHEPVTRQYDLVVMNPPFHQGRAADPVIGQGMIRAASAALKPRGRLFMVANNPLPYERMLEAAFGSHGETARNERFKVLWARR